MRCGGNAMRREEQASAAAHSNAPPQTLDPGPWSRRFGRRAYFTRSPKQKKGDEARPSEARRQPSPEPNCTEPNQSCARSCPTPMPAPAEQRRVKVGLLEAQRRPNRARPTLLLRVRPWAPLCRALRLKVYGLSWLARPARARAQQCKSELRRTRGCRPSSSATTIHLAPQPFSSASLRLVCPYASLGSDVPTAVAASFALALTVPFRSDHPLPLLGAPSFFVTTCLALGFFATRRSASLRAPHTGLEARTRPRSSGPTHVYGPTATRTATTMMQKTPPARPSRPSKSGPSSHKRRKSTSASDRPHDMDSDDDDDDEDEDEQDRFRHGGTDPSASHPGSRPSIQSRYRDDPSQPRRLHCLRRMHRRRNAPTASWSSNPPMSPPAQRPSAAYSTSATGYRPLSLPTSDLARQSASEYAAAASSLAQPTPYASSTYRDDALWTRRAWPSKISVPIPLSALTLSHQRSQNAAFRWMPTSADALSSDPTAGSYAPPPSASYLTAWTDATPDAARDMPMPLADLDTSSAVPASARPPSSLPLPNQDIFPFAPPNVDHTADYWLALDGRRSLWRLQLGRQYRSTCHQRQQRRAGPHSQASAFSPSSSDGLGGFLGNMHGSQNGRRFRRRCR
ncbi:hypothetical protein L1887_54391 [Cichorium endivia]|nr:hypothetical protein L1887_54391 [Cichorium endivia]